MSETLTLTLPTSLYEQSKSLVEAGRYSDFDDLVRTALRYILIVENSQEPIGLGAAERCAYYIEKLQTEIASAGGLFPGKSSEEVIKILRETRDQLYAEKYAPHFLKYPSHFFRYILLSA